MLVPGSLQTMPLDTFAKAGKCCMRRSSRVIPVFVLTYIHLQVQELQQQKYKSFNVLCDASPKGKLDVTCWRLYLPCWKLTPCKVLLAEARLPLVSVQNTAVVWAIQKMGDLQPSTVSLDAKLEEAQRVADGFAERMAEMDPKKSQKLQCLGSSMFLQLCACFPAFVLQLRPKALSKVRQRRLASREQLRALGHVMDLLQTNLRKPEHVLRPLNVTEKEVRLFHDGLPFLWNPETGDAEWDVAGSESLETSLRLIIQPDEGSPMYCCYRFLAARGFKINLIRDEL